MRGPGGGRGSAGLGSLFGALIVLVLVGWHGGEVQAQSQRYPAEPVDFDEHVEQRSTLWERVLDPHRQRYHDSIDHARRLIRSRTGSALAEAADVLREIAPLAPDNPHAYWLLGRVEERRHNWPECAKKKKKAFAIDPGYRPIDDLPSQRKGPWALDFSMGLCRIHVGAYERAITHFKRILSRGITEQTAVYRHLGEAYMALGRLGEAIAVLTTASRQPSSDARISYTLAAAYDRDEKEALARIHLNDALRKDRSLTQLKLASIDIVPPADEYYYFGLAHEAKGNVEWALAYFRRYLHLTGEGQWKRRVRQHLSDLVREPLKPGRLRIQGSNSADSAQILAAITAVDRELQACLASVPGLLLRVSITVVSRRSSSSRRSRSRSSRRSTPPQGIKTDVLYAFATEPEKSTRAQQCVEAAAQHIAVPAPPANTARYLKVSFPVIAREPM